MKTQEFEKSNESELVPLNHNLSGEFSIEELEDRLETGGCAINYGCDYNGGCGVNY